MVALDLAGIRRLVGETGRGRDLGRWRRHGRAAREAEKQEDGDGFGHVKLLRVEPVLTVRQALRLYQAVANRSERGEKLIFENDATKEKSELMLL